jgi:hypothetical protein
MRPGPPAADPSPDLWRRCAAGRSLSTSTSRAPRARAPSRAPRRSSRRARRGRRTRGSSSSSSRPPPPARRRAGRTGSRATRGAGGLLIRITCILTACSCSRPRLLIAKGLCAATGRVSTATWKPELPHTPEQAWLAAHCRSPPYSCPTDAGCWAAARPRHSRRRSTARRRPGTDAALQQASPFRGGPHGGEAGLPRLIWTVKPAFPLDRSVGRHSHPAGATQHDRQRASGEAGPLRPLAQTGSAAAAFPSHPLPPRSSGGACFVLGRQAAYLGGCGLPAQPRGPPRLLAATALYPSVLPVRWLPGPLRLGKSGGQSPRLGCCATPAALQHIPRAQQMHVRLWALGAAPPVARLAHEHTLHDSQVTRRPLFCGAPLLPPPPHPSWCVSAVAPVRRLLPLPCHMAPGQRARSRLPPIPAPSLSGTLCIPAEFAATACSFSCPRHCRFARLARQAWRSRRAGCCLCALQLRRGTRVSTLPLSTLSTQHCVCGGARTVY